MTDKERMTRIRQATTIIAKYGITFDEVLTEAARRLDDDSWNYRDLIRLIEENEK